MMRNIQVLLVALFAASGYVHSTHLSRERPSFVSTPQNVIVMKKASVVLNCTIQDLGSYSVMWRYLDHDMTLSVNETIYASNKDHYKILRPPTSDENKTTKTFTNWFLEIKNVDVADIGYYGCEIKDVPGLLQVSLVKLEGVATPPRPMVVQKTNYTDCCQKDNVTTACLPMCSPHSFDSETFHFELCHKNLSAILKCGSDGRNHIPCCQQRQIPNYCLDLCMNQVNFTNFTTYMAKGCYDRMKDITECFAEGQVALPGPPVKIHSNPISKSSAFVGWDAPKFNKDLVIGYRLFYAEEKDEHFTSSHLIQELYYILNNLKVNTYYKLYVQAVSKHGSSLPSYQIKVFVKDMTVIEGGKLVTDCCKNKRVSTKCLPHLCGGPLSYTSSDKMMECVGDFQKALGCYSGSRDHTPCCLAKGIHESCLDFCKGRSSPGLVIDHLLCISYMNDISNCLMEGLAILPHAPEDLSISSVTVNKAYIAWKPPTLNPERVMHYIVKYKPKHSDLIKPKQVQVDSHTLNTTLKNLTKGTLYEAYVVSGNSAGGSPPSSTAYFLTYSSVPDSGIVLPPARKAPFNVTECCVEEKLDAKCLPLCSYSTDITAQNLVPIFCKSSTLTKKILTCGTDSRDHTPCCKREKLPEKCLSLCAVTTTSQIDTNHKDCFIQRHMTTIFKCYEEGNALLPLPPQEVTIKTVAAHTASIAWKEPAKTPEGVFYYIVEHKKDSDTAWTQENTTQKEFTIQHLTPDSRYLLRVRSGNIYGTSLHSNVLSTIRTNPEATGGTVPTLPPPSRTLTNFTSNISDCCTKSQVSDACKPLCTGAQLGSMLQCKNEFNKIVSCAADQRDHSTCCMGHAVPSFCLKYCRGESADQLTALACATHLEQIRGCFFEGYNKLPSPPREFTIKSVKVNEIDSEWKPAKIAHDKTVYNLHYDESGPNVNIVKENVTSPNELKNLSSNTLYDLYTVSVNKYGSSLPSTSFSVYTYEKSSDAMKIVVSYSPKGYIREGQDVTFKCLASATSTGTPVIEWWRGGKKLVTGGDYKVTNVKVKDSGNYSCYVTNNSEKPKIKNIYLRMQYRPSVTVKDIYIDVPPRQQLDGNLTCYFKGYPQKLTWYKNGYDMDRRTYTTTKKLYHDSTGITEFNLVIAHIVISDYANYSCVGVTPGLGSATGYIHLYDRPTVSVGDPWVDTPSRQHKNAALSCTFRGYPEKLVWYFNGYEMQKFIYAYVTTVRNDTTGITEFNLMIEKVITSDYGIYSCVGSTPGLGQATAYIHLYDNTTSVRPVLKPAAKVLNVTDCCVSKGVAEKCRVACQFDVDLSTMQDVLVDCIKDLQNIVLCGADGKDHTSCCNTNHIPLECQPFCAGVVPKLPMDKLLYCLGFSTTIISCMEIGSVLIPSAPRNIRATSGTTWLDVQWDQPLKNADFVQQYHVFYRISSGGTERMIMVFRWRTKVRIENLSSGKEYIIYVLAVNHHGRSAYSNSLFISTTGYPYPPQQLICIPTNNNLRLSWNAPVGNVPYSKFHVYYRADEITGDFTRLETSSFNMLLDELKAGQQYTIFVRSYNGVGESKESNKCHVLAPGSANNKITGIPVSTRSNIGLGVGLGIVLIILVIAAGVLLYYMWKKRAATANKKPTVSFENPAYKPRTDNPDGAGGVQISGLPSQMEQPIQTFGPQSSAVPGPQSATGANGADTVISNRYAESSMSSPAADDDLGVVVGQLDVKRLDPSQVKVDINYDAGVSES